MKITVRCANCNNIKRRSECFKVKLVGSKIDDSMSLTKPNWVEFEEEIWLCKTPCAENAGYKTHVQKNKTLLN